MKVSNIRFGFATNSSSVHSIVYNKNLKDDYDSQDFGWSEWVVSSKEGKSFYLGQTLFHTLEPEIGSELATAIVHDLLKVTPDPNGYVDHQSFIKLPLNLKSKQVSLEFFTELAEKYFDPKLAIVGGNDNDEHCKFPDSERHEHLIPDDVYGTIYCRKDGDWWTLINVTTGTKIRLSFNDDAKPYTKSVSPELIDLKITDFCLMDCDFCYQNSSIDGKHATTDNLGKIIWALSDMKVFEVALGGGEPTRHPYFTKIVEDLHRNGILVNFTTRDLSWVSDSNIVNCVEKYVSRFGVSVNSGHDVAAAFKKIPSTLHDKIYFHYVINTGYLESIIDGIRNGSYQYSDVHPPLILLGFKDKGRGLSYKSKSWFKPEDSWIDIINKKYCTIGIDTALANQYKDKVQENFDKLLVMYDEGKFSMYIDAVGMIMGRSSYCDDYTSIVTKDEWANLSHKIMKEFATY